MRIQYNGQMEVLTVFASPYPMGRLQGKGIRRCSGRAGLVNYLE